MLKFENQELQDRYQHDPMFRDNVNKSQREYLALVKKGQAAKLDIPEEILERFIKEGKQAIYFFYGFMQPPPGQKTTQLTLFFHRAFRPEPRQKFIFIYFNNQTASSDYYFEFKKILAMLPITVLEHLKEFILVKPYFYIKAFDYVGLGTINRLFKHRYITLDSCTQLLEHLNIPVKDFVTFVPEELSIQFPKTFKKRPSLVSYRINLEGQNMTEEQRKQKTEFELTIKALLNKQVYTIQNYQIGQIGIPIIIQLLIHYFRTKPQGLDQEGIFRKSVSIDEENQTLNELSKRNFEYLEQIKNPHLIASLIKRFFSNLKQPIILFKTYDELLHDQGVKNKKEHIKNHIKALPKLNFMTLAFLIEFLKKDVLPHEKNSKMSANNLAICFSPSLMRSQKPSMADLINASKAVAIANTLIADFEDIFGGQVNISNMYQSNLRRANQGFTEAIRKQLQIDTPEKQQQQEQYQVQISQPHPQPLPQQPIMTKQTQSSQIYDTNPNVISPKKQDPNMGVIFADQDQPLSDHSENPHEIQCLKPVEERQDLSKRVNKSSEGSKSGDFQVIQQKPKSQKGINVISAQLSELSQRKNSSTKSVGQKQSDRQQPRSNNLIKDSPPTKSIIRFSYSSRKDIKESS